MSITSLPRVWTVDAVRSTVEFSVRTFFGLGTVNGHFDRFAGSYVRRPDGGEIELTIDASSVDTGNPRRDRRLRSRDLFGRDGYPRVGFLSTRVAESDSGRLHVAGNLEILGETLPLAFEATIRERDEELEIEATATGDSIRLGVTPGLLHLIRPPVTLHVRARLV